MAFPKPKMAMAMALSFHFCRCIPSCHHSGVMFGVFIFFFFLYVIHSTGPKGEVTVINEGCYSGLRLKLYLESN